MGVQMRVVMQQTAARILFMEKVEREDKEVERMLENEI